MIGQRAILEAAQVRSLICIDHTSMRGRSIDIACRYSIDPHTRLAYNYTWCLMRVIPSSLLERRRTNPQTVA